MLALRPASFSPDWVQLNPHAISKRIDPQEHARVFVALGSSDVRVCSAKKGNDIGKPRNQDV